MLTIGSREKYGRPLSYSRIILMIVTAGSGWTAGSHSVEIRLVAITSSFIENHLSLTFALFAASRNCARSPRRSIEGRIVFERSIFRITIS